MDASAMLASLFDDEQIGDPFDEVLNINKLLSNLLNNLCVYAYRLQKKMFVNLRKTLKDEDFGLVFDKKVGDFLQINMLMKASQEKYIVYTIDAYYE